jgi:hypothetical protein
MPKSERREREGEIRNKSNKQQKGSLVTKLGAFILFLF